MTGPTDVGRSPTMRGVGRSPTGIERAARSRRASVRTRPWRIAIAAVALALGLGAVAPVAMVAMGRRRAAACLEQYTHARGPIHPECGNEMRWFLFPARVPWTSWDARYRAEELLSRLAISNYVDAAVGQPDAAALARAVPNLESAERTVKRGSRRPAMDDLGVAIGAPELGRSADDVGDRATLIGRAKTWTEWQVRLHALDAALVEGDVKGAGLLAKHYADFDPRDEELRSQLAALLCMTGDSKRGIEMLTSVEDDRAARRYAAMARDWGEVRAVLVACAAHAGVVPPPKPTSTEAGRGDAPEPRAVLRVKLAVRDARGSVGGSSQAAAERERVDAIEAAVGLLKLPRRTTSGRRALLAVVLASGYRTTPAGAVDLARPDDDAGDLLLVPSIAITATDLLEQPAELPAMAPPSTYADTADRLLELAKRADGEAARTLRTAAGALLLEAGRLLALAADGTGAAAAFDRAGALCLPGEVAPALARSSAWYVAGDAARALGELDAVDLQRSGSDAPTRALRAAALVQRAEVLASLGRREDAARAALAADDAAKEAGDPALDVRARFLRIALAPAGQRLREEDARSARPAPLGRLGWTWLGFADAGAPWTRGAAEPAVVATLAAWDHAISAPADERVALRYEVLRLRGDAIRWPATRLALGASLAEGAGEVETWLDAFYALDARRLSRRAYVWSRAEAARWRGDATAAAAWAKRYRALAELASDPGLLEIARFAGI